tara:strand:+ start:771 stop:1238 length:468 start_codon:yes stop_codon:yes gene_type:complete
MAFDETGKFGPTLTFHEILVKVNNAKDKPKKLEVLKHYDTAELRMVLKSGFDPNITWDLPEGTPPYKTNEAPEGTEHTYLKREARRLYHFIKGGNPNLSQNKREMMFLQMLEGLSKEEAELILAAKDKELNKKYKGLTANLVKDAFNWNDSFMQK